MKWAKLEARARAPRSSVSKMNEFVATQQNPAATGRSETAGRRADRRPPGVPDWRKALRQSEGNPAGGWNRQAPARTTHPSAGRLAPTTKRRGAKRGGTHRCRRGSGTTESGGQRPSGTLPLPVRGAADTRTGTLRALAARHPPKKPPATQPQVVLEQHLLAAPRRVTPARRRQSHHFRSLHERFSGRNPHWF